MADGGGTRRSRKRRWFAAAAALLVAAIVLSSILDAFPGYEPPWTVWAVRTSAAGVTPLVFGRAAATVGGETLSGDWQPTGPGFPGPGAVAGFSRSPPKGFVERLWMGLLGSVAQEARLYVCNGVERTDGAGATWTQFVQSSSTESLLRGAIDPRCAGTWEVATAGGGARRTQRFTLGPGGTVAAGGSGIWRVRDGVLWAEIALDGPRHCEFAGVLDADVRSFAGTLDYTPATGRRVDE